MNTRIFAHRGASGYAPENTLEAFDLAVRQGAHGVELDVHLCRSGELVVAHDETVDRVSDGSGTLRSLSLKELKALRFNRTHPEYTDARLPLLSEVFQLLRPTGLCINIELKNSVVDYPLLEQKVLDAAAREFDLNRVIFSSFNHYSMLRMKKLAPSVPCGLLYEAALVRPWEWMPFIPISRKCFYPVRNASLRMRRAYLCIPGPSMRLRIWMPFCGKARIS